MDGVTDNSSEVSREALERTVASLQKSLSTLEGRHATAVALLLEHRDAHGPASSHADDGDPDAQRWRSARDELLLEEGEHIAVRALAAAHESLFGSLPAPASAPAAEATDVGDVELVVASYNPSLLIPAEWAEWDARPADERWRGTFFAIHAHSPEIAAIVARRWNASPERPLADAR